MRADTAVTPDERPPAPGCGRPWIVGEKMAPAPCRTTRLPRGGLEQQGSWLYPGTIQGV